MHKSPMSCYLILFLKGLAMGAANVIPGVSGGTIALMTGIYHRLLNALKSVDSTALKLAATFRIRALTAHIDGYFLGAVLAGVATSIISLAKLLKWLLHVHPTFVMAFFFGIILASVYYVGKSVERWSLLPVLTMLLGLSIAISIAFLAPASENDAPLYLVLCGVVAICSMILPGLSGSFVLILMGNYALVLGALSQFNLSVIIPIGLGCVLGLLVFSRLLSLIYTRYKNLTIALMTGFVLGSLMMIWPWKDAITRHETIHGEMKTIIIGYTWNLPQMGEPSTLIALALIGLGLLSLVIMEKLTHQSNP